LGFVSVLDGGKDSSLRSE